MKYISVLGWEQRFIQGLENNLKTQNITEVVIFKYQEYLKTTKENLSVAIELCLNNNILLEEHTIIYNDTVGTWHKINKWTLSNIEINEEVYLDITTMPRETIWTFLFCLLQKTKSINYLYASPNNYAKEWLCKEPDKPRLLFKHSGVTEFGKDTALFLLTGFDADRVGQLVNYYEPKITILCSQTGDQYENEKRNNIEEHKKQCAGLTQIETCFINSYSEDHGMQEIEEIIHPISQKYNVIASSLGPKLSAVALYKVFRKMPNIALTYVPTKEYSLKYSEGMKEVLIFKY